VDIRRGEDHSRRVGVHKAFQPYRRKRPELSRVALRERCEETRLDLRALFRALDRCRLMVDLPVELQSVMELDADLAEALWALGQPRGRIDLRALERDTLASLGQIPTARERMLDRLSVEDRADLLACAAEVREELTPGEAYTDIPGYDPRAG